MRARPRRLSAGSPRAWRSRRLAASARAPRLSLVARETAEGGSHVELLSAEAAAGRRAAWSDLVLRSLEPNVFLEPDFALPAAQHIVAARRPVFLLVTDRSRAGKPGELIGLAALHLPRRRHAGPRQGLVPRPGRPRPASARPHAGRRSPRPDARLAGPRRAGRERGAFSLHADGRTRDEPDPHAGRRRQSAIAEHRSAGARAASKAAAT